MCLNVLCIFIRLFESLDVIVQCSDQAFQQSSNLCLTKKGGEEGVDGNSVTGIASSTIYQEGEVVVIYQQALLVIYQQSVLVIY